MTKQQHPQPFRFVLEFDGDIVDSTALTLDQLTTVRDEGSDEVAPHIEEGPFEALRLAIMERALRELTLIPGVRMRVFPNYMRHPNERGGYDEFVLPEVLSQAEMQQKWDEVEQQHLDGNEN